MRSPVPFALAAVSCVAFNAPSLAQTVTVDDLLARSFTDNSSGRTLPYRLFVPANYDPGQSYPLVLFLHGLGERGNDNRSQLSVWPSPLDFVQAADQAAHPCLFVAPQCPTDDLWVNVGTPVSYSVDSTPMTSSLSAVSHLLDNLQTEFSVDPSRLYVTGLSMGGYGTWDLLAREPGRFAAAIPIAGGGDPTKAGAMTDTGIWAFHAIDDGGVPVEASRTMIDAIQDAGGNPRYTEYPDGGHFIWDRTYHNPEVRDWLFTNQAAIIPEPGSLALAAFGLLALGMRRHLRQRNRVG